MSTAILCEIPDLAHEGDCGETLCPQCGCCAHSPEGTCPPGSCLFADCVCAW